MVDLENYLDVVQSLNPAARTASANGAGVDLANYNGAMVVLHVGTITDGTHTPRVEESSDNSTYTTVAASDLIGSLAALATGVVQKVGYIGSRRYIRVATTVNGATNGGVYGASVVRGFPRKGPK
jgi:hypothetical protein